MCKYIHTHEGRRCLPDIENSVNFRQQESACGWWQWAPEDPRQLGLLQAAATWAERPDPGIRGSSSDASATHYLHCSSQSRPPLRKIIQLLPRDERMYLT